MFRQTPAPQHWYNISIGSAEAHISLTINTKEDLLGCEIYINDNKLLFNFLKSQQVAVEQQLGATLEWIEAKKACRAVQRKENADIDNEAGITTLFDWLIDRAIAFEKVLGPLVKKFKKEESAKSLRRRSDLNEMKFALARLARTHPLCRSDAERDVLECRGAQLRWPSCQR